MPRLQDVVAFDIGHSSVKGRGVTSTGEVVSLFSPSVVIPAFSISYEAAAARAEKDTVELDGRKYFTGETALLQGGAAGATGLSDHWVHTPEHSVLILAAVRKMKEMGAWNKPTMLVLGLPVQSHKADAQKLKELVGQLIPDVEIKVIPQPMGPYQELMHDQHGKPATGRNMAEESWAVIDIGHYTTDFMLMAKGEWKELLRPTCKGVHLAAEQLQTQLRTKQIAIDFSECEEALTTRKIRSFGKEIDVSADVNEATGLVVSTIIDNANRLLEQHVRRLDGIILAGGGANLVAKELKVKWPHTVVPNDARFSIAEGMRRFGLAILHSREASGKAKKVAA